MKCSISILVLLLFATGALAQGSQDKQLLAAAEQGRLTKVKQLLLEGASVNARSEGGETQNLIEIGRGVFDTYGQATPLMLAVDNGHLAVARELLRAGADVNAAASDGRTILMIAVVKQRLAILQELFKQQVNLNARLEQGAIFQVTKPSSDPGMMTVTKLKIASAMDAAIQVGDTVLAQYLVDKGAQPRDVERLALQTLLTNKPGRPGSRAKQALLYSGAGLPDDVFNAALHGDVPAIEKWLAAGGDVNARDDEFGITAVHVATTNKQWTVAAFLLDKGCDVTLESLDGDTPLMAASREGMVERLFSRLLEKGARTDARDSGGNTALMFAAGQGFPTLVTLLIGAGADVNAVNDRGETPLSLSAKFKDIPKILKKAGAKDRKR